MYELSLKAKDGKTQKKKNRASFLFVIISSDSTAIPWIYIAVCLNDEKLQFCGSVTQRAEQSMTLTTRSLGSQFGV